MPDQNQWHFWLSVSRYLPTTDSESEQRLSDSRHSVTRSQTSGGGLDLAYGYATMPCPCIQYMCANIDYRGVWLKNKTNVGLIVGVNKCNDF